MWLTKGRMINTEICNETGCFENIIEIGCVIADCAYFYLETVLGHLIPCVFTHVGFMDLDSG